MDYEISIATGLSGISGCLKGVRNLRVNEVLRMKPLRIYMLSDLGMVEGSREVEVTYAFSSDEHGAWNALIREDFS